MISEPSFLTVLLLQDILNHSEGKVKPLKVAGKRIDDSLVA